MAITIQELLQIAVENDASDLHITTYIPPRIRVHGTLISIDHPPLSPAETKNLVYSLLTDRQKKMFEEKLELDFSFGYPWAIFLMAFSAILPWVYFKRKGWL